MVDEFADRDRGGTASAETQGEKEKVEIYENRKQALTHPTTAQERVETIDIVRGFALAGVFLINFQQMISWADLDGTANAYAAWFLESIIAGKFYRLFAFLFGVGFALQMFRLEARGAPFVRLYSRRLAVLFVIGLTHGMLLWPNDILALFAQLGVLLLLIRHVSNRVLVVIGVACLFAAPTYYYVSTDFADFHGAAEQTQNERQQTEDNAEQVTDRVRSEGSYRDVVVWTTSQFLGWQTNLFGRLLSMREDYLMFLLGLYAGRRKLFERVNENASFIRRTMVATLAVGLLAFPIISLLTELAAHPVNGHLAITMRQVLIAIQAAAISLFYGLAFLLTIERFQLHRRLRPVANIGRMALSNYLLLSILVTTAFYDYGLGLYGRVTVLEGIAMAVVTYILVAVSSSWWLGRFRFGPAEWVWRSLTYGSMQPMNPGQSPT